MKIDPLKENKKSLVPQVLSISEESSIEKIPQKTIPLYSKYQEALHLYVDAKNLSCIEICRRCGVTEGAFRHFLKKYFPNLIRKGKRVKSLHHKNQKVNTKSKYKRAIELYATTDLTVKQISDELQVSVTGLYRHITLHHRELMFKRNHIEIENYNPSKVKIRKKDSGQTLQSNLKYKKAISACSSEKYLDCNISEIARLFKLDPTGLGNQLKVHFPEILKWRENERIKLGLNDNKIRGARKESKLKYSKAIKLLRSSDLTIREIADACNVSFSGLKNHLVLYNKDIVKIRLNKRENAKKIKKPVN